MQKRYMSVASVLLCLMGFVFFTGCGESLFKGLDGDTSATTAQEAAERGDYSKALTLSQSIIDNPNTTDAEKQDAYAQKGIALLGINNISLLSMSEILKETDESNIVDTLSDLFQITPSASEDIAEAFNQAYTLGGGSLSSLTSAHLSVASSSSLDKNKQLLRGMANLSVVVKMTTRVFDISTEGTVTLVADTVESYGEALDYLMGGSRTVFYYAENAIDGFTAADAFTAYQLEQASKVRVVGLNIKNLYAIKNIAENNTGTNPERTFVLKTYSAGVAVDVTGGSAYSRVINKSDTGLLDNNLHSALTAIFTYIRNN